MGWLPKDGGRRNAENDDSNIRLYKTTGVPKSLHWKALVALAPVELGRLFCCAAGRLKM
jgi:hypothetical protein